MADRPFRLQFSRIGWVSRVQQYISETDLGHLVDFPAPRKTLIDMAGGGQPNPPISTILTWIYHPDERIPAELIRTADERAIWQGTSQEHLYWRPKYRAHDFGAKLRKRAQRDASRGGWIWTPLLDLYAAENMHLREHHREGNQWVGWKEQQLAQLGSWIEQQENPGPLLELLQFQAREIRIMVARHSPELGPRLIRHLVVQEQEIQPSLNPVLAAVGENPNLTRKGLLELARLLKHDPFYLVQWVLAHPRADKGVRNRVAGLLVEGGHQAHLDHFLQKKNPPQGALADLLAREGDWDTLQDFIQQIDEPADRFIQIASQRFPRQVLRLLEDMSSQLAGQVSRQGLLFYFNHEDPQLRQRALRLLGRLEG